MRISKITVIGLFNQFDHELVFNPDERITIVTGPNGFGKTMILRMLDTLFNRSVRSLTRMPFDEFNISFDDETILRISRLLKAGNLEDGVVRHPLKLEHIAPAKTLGEFQLQPKFGEEHLQLPIGAIEDFIPSLDQIGREEWRDHSTGEILELEDVVSKYGEEFPAPYKIFEPIPPWLEEIREAIPIRFIGIERLTQPIENETRFTVSHRRFQNPFMGRTVRLYSDKLARMVQHTLTEYATYSQSLDRTFPVRLVEDPPNISLTAVELGQRLLEVEEKRSRIVDAGLLTQDEENLKVPAIDKVDESKQGVLAVYAQDALRKLSVFDELYERVNTLKRIANARFLYKKVSVNTNGLKVAALDGCNLDLEMLSSGEQHELVLLFDLLFGIDRNTLILIDEPELSLHVAWQDEVLSDLQHMALLSDFQVLLATHSPQIIGERWDLTVSLEGPNTR